jgi:WD40 repeat protein
VGLVASRSIAAQALSHLFQSKDHYTGPVAHKVAEFKEEFYPAALAFNSDASQLAVNFMVASDGVHVWNWRDPKHIPRILDYPGGADDGHALSYSPDGKLLAVRHGITLDGKAIRVWNAATGELAHDVVAQDAIGSFRGPGSAAGFVFSPDGEFLVLAIDRFHDDPRNKVLVFQTNTWELAWGLPTSPFQSSVVAFSPDGKLLALSGYVGPTLNSVPSTKILLFDITTRQIVRTIDAPFGEGLPVSALTWSPNGLHLAAGGCAGCGYHPLTGIPPSSETVNVFEVATGTRVVSVRGRLSSLDGLAYSPNGKYLIAGSIDNTVRIMDGHSYALLQSIPGDGRSVAVSRDSRYLAISAFPKISIWELK